jgi:hypothetical protein
LRVFVDRQKLSELPLRHRPMPLSWLIRGTIL